MVDSVRDHLIAARRDTALSLVRHLMFDIADWYCSVQNVASSLASSCPVHQGLGRFGDATLECWIGRRNSAAATASTERAFTIMKEHGFELVSLEPASGRGFDMHTCCAEVAWVRSIP